VFFRLKWLPWGWLSGTVTVFVGLLICAIFVGLLNHVVPTGRVAVTGKVVEVTSNVSGQIIDIPVQSNKLVNANAVLFKIDPTPFEVMNAIPPNLKRPIGAELREATQDGSSTASKSRMAELMGDFFGSAAGSFYKSLGNG
jgi:multidrug efflux pump subunit AcrA (membrane-fusion protein)